MSKAHRLPLPESSPEPGRLATPLDGAALAALAARYGSPLVVIDCERIRVQYRRLAAALPGVDLYYALKPLPEPAVVEALKQVGAFFDLASSGEVELVRAAGVAPERCIHSHPMKRDADIRDALRYGVRTFVADNADEIGKFIRHRKRAELLIRVAFRASKAVCDLSRKFGCEPAAVPELLRVAAQLGVRVVGLSFHAGSQAAEPGMHARAIEACGELIRAARAAGHAQLELLDIGGGFPVDYQRPAMPIEEFCAPLRAALAALPEGLRLIAEPGRYIAAPAGTCVATVVGRAIRDGQPWYYLDDGLYGSFSGQLFDHARFRIESLGRDGERVPSVLAGPTCDSIDIVAEDLPLPRLEIGDRIVGHDMGAYCTASATDFNFIRRARVIAVNRESAEATVVALRPR